MNCTAVPGRVYQKPSPGPGPRCLALFVLLWSLLQLCVGLALLGAGIYGYIAPRSLQPYLDLWQDLLRFDGRIVVLAMGGAGVALALVCLVGVVTERKQLLQVYCYSVIFLLLLQLGFALFLFLNKESILVLIEGACYDRLALQSPHFVKVFGAVEEALRCCGCMDPADYSRMRLPSTCLHQEDGCLPTIYELVEAHSSWVIVAGSVSAFSLLSVILLINCYLIRHYKTLPQPPAAPSTPRNKVTPSPSLSSTQLNNWVCNPPTSAAAALNKRINDHPFMVSREASF